MCLREVDAGNVFVRLVEEENTGGTGDAIDSDAASVDVKSSGEGCSQNMIQDLISDHHRINDANAHQATQFTHQEKPEKAQKVIRASQTSVGISTCRLSWVGLLCIACSSSSFDYHWKNVPVFLC